MPFDFNEVPLRIYGIWPQTPFPLEVSIYGYCQMACSYCFANRNRDAAGRELNPKNSAPALFRKIERAVQDETDPVGFFLREKYPICFSNTTDPFQRAERTHRATEAFLAWSGQTRTPLYIQTRGNVLHEEWERYRRLLVPGLHVVYLSICHQDDKDRKFHEPGALAIESRWELAGMLRDHGIPVVAACNPYLKEWVPSAEKYVANCSTHGVRGVWLEHLHFTASQADCVAKPYRDMLSKGNVLPMFMVNMLKPWYAATKAAGIDFYPTPFWDNYHGHAAKNPECADPSWFGGKTLGFNFDVAKLIHQTSTVNKKAKVLIRWEEIAEYMRRLGVPNPTLDVGPFWYPFNNKVKADIGPWKARLGKQAPLYEIVRYFWNHPWENRFFLWYAQLMQPLYSAQHKEYVTDNEDGDILALYNPSVRHHGPATIDPDAIQWGEVVSLGHGVL